LGIGGELWGEDDLSFYGFERGEELTRAVFFASCDAYAGLSFFIAVEIAGGFVKDKRWYGVDADEMRRDLLGDLLDVLGEIRMAITTIAGEQSDLFGGCGWDIEQRPTAWWHIVRRHRQEIPLFCVLGVRL
jgi:hypothetical protein